MRSQVKASSSVEETGKGADAVDAVEAKVGSKDNKKHESTHIHILDAALLLPPAPILFGVWLMYFAIVTTAKKVVMKTSSTVLVEAKSGCGSSGNRSPVKEDVMADSWRHE